MVSPICAPRALGLLVHSRVTPIKAQAERQATRPREDVVHPETQQAMPSSLQQTVTGSLQALTSIPTAGDREVTIPSPGLPTQPGREKAN